MENATTAVYIAAGTLLGVMILSLVVFFFRRVGTLQEERDRIMTADQLAEWNNEYLAYDKKLMYGTDLVSVLNKATSNNEKYVNGKGFLSGYTYNNSYLIDIEFTIKTPLEDTITVMYIDNIAGKEYPYADAGPDSPPKLFDTFQKYNISMYKGSSSINTNINNTTLLKSDTYTPSKFGASTYKLLDGDHLDTMVAGMMKLSNSMTMEVNNPDKTNVGAGGWSRATWKTCLADLKSRKYKCTDVIYDTSSENTGRIVKMCFEEIGN